MTVIADATRPVGARRRHGRARHRGRSETTTDIFIEVGELRAAAHASHAAPRRPLDRRELSLRARRRRRRSRRARSSVWRSSSSRSPAGASRARRSTSTPATRRRSRSCCARSACSACSACRCTPSTRRALLRSVGCVADVEDAGTRCACIPPTWRLDLVARDRPHRGGRAPARLRAASRRDPSVSAGHVHRRAALDDERAAARRALPPPACSRCVRCRSSPAATSTCACSIRSPRTRRTCAARCSSRSRAAPSTTCRTCRATSGCSRSARRSRPAIRFPTRRCASPSLVMGDREPVHFAGPAVGGVRRVGCEGTRRANRARRVSRRRRSRSSRPSDGADVLWSVLVDGAARGEVRRCRSMRRSGRSRRSASRSCSARCRTATSRRRASTRTATPERRRRAATRAIPRAADHAGRRSSTSRCSSRTASLAAQVEQVIRAAAGELLERLELFDLYEGAGVDAGTGRSRGG